MPAKANNNADFELSRDPWGRLVLTDQAGQQHVGVSVARAFPLSDPLHAVSICDVRGREIAYVDSLETLSHELRELVEGELARRAFMPTIVRILNDPRPTEPSYWEVLTDHGKTTFKLQREADVRRFDEQRVLVVDSNGIRYQVADIRKLDAHSRRVLDRLL